MEYLQLIHEKKIGLSIEKSKLFLPTEDFTEEDCTCVTFRPIHDKKSIVRMKSGVHACNRKFQISTKNIICYGLETDSQLAPLIFWDIAHKIDIGSKITVAGESTVSYFMDRDYFTSGFQRSDCKNGVTYTKIALLLAEESSGLDEWTFGIPTGPGDATMLNAVVKRILEFKCKEKEIILCGRPGENFKYWDNVKIVGEDIPAPPVQISRKKNRIAQEAKYDNLCVLHDRVFLPSDFMEAIQEEGDYYPLTTFQSLYFDDYNNLIPHRYSDYCVVLDSELGKGLGGVELSVTGEISRTTPFSNTLIKYFDKNTRFYLQNPCCYTPHSYPTGSLYIMKKKVWLFEQMDDNLLWEDFEDVEWGCRLSTKGIPNCINPNTFSQSCNSRTAIIGAGVVYLEMDNKEKKWFPKTHYISTKRKPFYKVTEKEAWSKLYQYRNKYCPNFSLKPTELTFTHRKNIVFALLSETRFEMNPDSIRVFLKDAANLLFLGSMSKEFIEYEVNNFMQIGNKAMGDVALFFEFTACAVWRNDKYFFMNSSLDFAVKSTAWLRICSYLTALRFIKNHHNFIYHPEKIKGYYNGILNSTPYLEYFEE